LHHVAPTGILECRKQDDFFLSQQINRSVPSDPKNPSFKTPLLVKPLEILPGLQEHLLRRILLLRVLCIAEESVHETVDDLKVPPEQNFKRWLIASC
jgi:hypothetical protein